MISPPVIPVVLGALLWAASSSHLSARAAAASEALEQKVRSDMARAGDKAASPARPFAWYVVPAMSNIKRLETTYPSDGALAAPVRIIAAKGEYEPASIVFYPFEDAEKVELKVSDLKGKNGVIPSTAMDVKVVKIWVQAGIGWYSYFNDPKGRTFVPELLLNDEKLIKVDRKTEDNYLRIDYPAPRGSSYYWISNPGEIEVPLNDHREPISDAASLQPFEFKRGEFKQLWFTLEAPENAEGIYRGEISITVNGKPGGSIPIEVRVLPFSLPAPKTNYDLEREYYTSMYNGNDLKVYVNRNGGDLEKAKKRLFNEYTNMRKHNLLNPMIREFRLGNEEIFTASLELYKKAGLKTDTIFGAVGGSPYHYWMVSPAVTERPLALQPEPEDYIRAVDKGHAIVKSIFGDAKIYCFGWDEPSMKMLVAHRKPWKILHERGLNSYITAKARHLNHAGYNEDFVTIGGQYSKEASDQWHAIGARVTSYAAPHTGPENPDFVRRTHGIDLYKADADGTNNYKLNGSAWNDFSGGGFRAFNLVYPTINGPIDTLQWEGFREAIDDVRYATLLKQLANQAIASGTPERVYEGRMALQWLALLDPKTCDLNAMRLEMISYILDLSNSR